MSESASLERVQEQMTLLSKRLLAVEAENLELRGSIVSESDDSTAPKYMVLAGGYYSPDDVLYPEGSIFEDLTGRITPNEQMEPMNAAAERKMREYLHRLPLVGRTPTVDLIMEAAMQLRPKDGDEAMTNAEFQGMVLQRALELKYQKEGVVPPKDIQMTERSLPKQMGNVPVMANTRVSGSSSFKQPSQTKLRQAPVAPADKAQPVDGGSRSSLIGRFANQGARI